MGISIIVVTHLVFFLGMGYSFVSIDLCRRGKAMKLQRGNPEIHSISGNTKRDALFLSVIIVLIIKKFPFLIDSTCACVGRHIHCVYNGALTRATFRSRGDSVELYGGEIGGRVGTFCSFFSRDIGRYIV